MEKNFIITFSINGYKDLAGVLTNKKRSHKTILIGILKSFSFRKNRKENIILIILSPVEAVDTNFMIYITDIITIRVYIEAVQYLQALKIIKLSNLNTYAI